MLLILETVLKWSDEQTEDDRKYATKLDMTEDK